MIPRSITTRILAGFLVVTLAFIGAMGFTLFRMSQVRRQLTLMNRSYLRLTLILGELHTICGNLLNIVAERASGRGSSAFIRRQVRLARQYRLHDVRRALALVRDASKRAREPAARTLLHRMEAQLQSLESSFLANEVALQALFGEGEMRGPEALAQTGEDLLRAERRLVNVIRKLRDDTRAQVRETAVAAATNQRHAAWATLALVLIALGVSVTVALGARHTLAPLGTLVESTKRIAAGDYAQRVRVTSEDELGLLAAEFNKMAAAVEERERRLLHSERMAAAGRLAAHITHEVRNPLNALSLNTELLEEEIAALPADRVEESRALVRAIHKEVDRLTSITEEYLRFARLPNLSLEPLDVNDVLASLLAFMKEDLAASGVRTVRRLERGLPRVAADENQLRQAFINLVRNAAEAMEEGGGGELRVRTALVGERVEVRIADSGPGIPAQEMGKIFEPFYSTKQKGTGLGLALTQRIVQEHKGSITVASEPGAGTVVTVSLPVEEEGDG